MLVHQYNLVNFQKFTDRKKNKVRDKNHNRRKVMERIHFTMIV